MISLRLKYILFTALTHGVLILLSVQFLPERRGLFFLAELLILISLFIAIRIFRAFIAPINLMHHGTQTLRDGDFNSRLVEVGQRELDDLIQVFNTMMDRLRQERLSQQEQQYFLGKLIEASPSGVLILDFDDRVSTANPRALQLLGCSWEALAERPLAEVDAPLARHLAVMDNGSRIIRLDARRAYRAQKAAFLDRGFQHAFLLLEELTAEFHSIEKQAYSKIIRLMSHEINNSIGAINSILRTTLDQQPETIQDPEIRSALEVAMERNRNLNRFVKNYADVVRLPPPNLQPTDLHTLLEGVVDLFDARCHELEISVHWDLYPDPITVQLDAGQMEQVLINIFRNAMDAIGSRGRITILTDINPKTICLRDTGTGIDESIRESLFSPFFSSKPNGQGIGLTLSREILENHGCAYSLGPNATGETTFTIRFDD